MQNFNHQGSRCAQAQADSPSSGYIEMTESSGIISNEVELQQVDSVSEQQHDETTAMAMEDQEDENVVDVQIKVLGDERLSLRCRSDIQISSLKQRVLEAKSMQDEASESMREEPRSSVALRLIYKGKVLKNDQLLQSYSFNSGDTIHAVFGPADRNAAGNAQDAGSTNSIPQSQPASDNANSNTNANGVGQNAFFQSFGDGVMMGQIDIEANEGAAMPEWNTLFGSLLSGLQNSNGNGPTLANIRLFSDTGSDVMNGMFTNGMNQVQGSNTATTAPANRQTGGNLAAITNASSSNSTETTQSNRMNEENQDAGNPDQGTQTISLESRAANVLNQAASIRRSIPPLELNPLSRPPELSSELYTMGNAFREAGDTFLAIHRQLQFLSARFLQAHRLTVNERTRLHNRVQRLIPSLRDIQSLANGLTITLESSPFTTQAAQSATRPSIGVEGNQPQGRMSIRLGPFATAVGQDQAGSQVPQGNEDNPMVRFMTAMLSGAVPNAQSNTNASATPLGSSTPATASGSTQSEAIPPATSQEAIPSSISHGAISTLQVPISADNSQLVYASVDTSDSDEEIRTPRPNRDDVLSECIRAVADQFNVIMVDLATTSDVLFKSAYDNLSKVLEQHRFCKESVCTEMESRILLALQDVSTHRNFPNIATDSIFIGCLHATLQQLIHICTQRDGLAPIDAFRRTCQQFCGTVFWHFLSAYNQTFEPVRGTACIISEGLYSIDDSESVQYFCHRVHVYITEYLNAMVARAH
uniref:AlNc14C187G8352 protein n=1 Tax=Albugo laibachii Nc14 TaxID=890382 RepID=F0WPK7_9STRA|nr:AlNc14C187G8352 [Albugo laibachii Nc14]|eukprot:CCA23257.1 AlNc14C187G8352 [Albugo laibachii Nc14]